MANLVLINDNELRRRLRGHGFRPDGPITDTTREVYFRKLQRLDNTRSTPPSNTARTSVLIPSVPDRSSLGTNTIPLARVPATTTSSTVNRLTINRYGEYINPRGPRLPALNHPPDDIMTRQNPREDVFASDPIIHGIFGVLRMCYHPHIYVCIGSLGNLFLANFNDSSHITSDVCFVCQDGVVLYASRALLVTCCPQTMYLLYNTSGILSLQ